MNTIHRASPWILLAIFLGCSGPREASRSHVFTFTHDDRQYEIISSVRPQGEGSNDLILRDGRRVLLRARDTEQAGVVDVVLVGDATVQEANVIYASGLAQARAQGKFATYEPVRLFELQQEDAIYMLQTYMPDANTTYNKLTILDPRGDLRAIFIDTGANGEVDDRRAGTISHEAAQDIYRIVLDEALSQRRVEVDADRYIVKPHVSRQP